ncbi:MAG: hypothetical protein LBR30_06230 [Clostridioides sp.]|jgi:hypothetical protein|nr:hypothetical protein [Clostridioides sp.]
MEDRVDFGKSSRQKETIIEPVLFIKNDTLKSIESSPCLILGGGLLKRMYT